MIKSDVSHLQYDRFACDVMSKAVSESEAHVMCDCNYKENADTCGKFFCLVKKHYSSITQFLFFFPFQHKLPLGVTQQNKAITFGGDDTSEYKVKM